MAFSGHIEPGERERERERGWLNTKAAENVPHC